MTLTAVVTPDRVGEDERWADVIADAVAGDRIATFRLMAVIQPAVLHYCRARLGTGDTATAVARRICRTVAVTLSDLPGSGLAMYAFVHGIAVEAVDATQVPEGLEGMPGRLALLSPAQREVLVLRVAVGLSAEETAETLGSTPGAVRHVQHHALDRLRAAA
jgi:RNA polymerase sigma-70 factor (ECF subfamily)